MLTSVLQDIGSGLSVADAAACALECDGKPACNAASYYGDQPTDQWPGGDNCYLKTLGDACGVPADAAAAPGAIFMIKDSACASSINSHDADTSSDMLGCADRLFVASCSVVCVTSLNFGLGFRCVIAHAADLRT
jgi:hypothetical protein